MLQQTVAVPLPSERRVRPGCSNNGPWRAAEAGCTNNTEQQQRRDDSAAARPLMAPSRGNVCGQLLWCLRGSGSNVLDSADSSPTGKEKRSHAAHDWAPLPGPTASSSSEERSGAQMKAAWADGSTRGAARSAAVAAKNNRVVPLLPSSTGSAAGLQGSAGAPGTGRGHDASLRPRRPSTVPADLISAIDSFATVQAGQHSVTAGRPLTGEELHASGFKLYYPGNIATPGSTVAPLAFMVLDIARATGGAGHRVSRTASVDADEHTGAFAAASSHGGRGARHRLVPVFTNSSCRAYLKIADHADYVGAIRKLLKRDPLLSFALQKAVRHLKAGELKPVNHVTPDPSGQSSSLSGLRLTPCVWRHEGRILPALMVEHNLPYDTDVVMPRLMRDYAVLSHVPAILTMIDFQVRSDPGFGGRVHRSAHGHACMHGALHRAFSCPALDRY